MKRKAIDANTIVDIYIRRHDFHDGFQKINEDLQMTGSNVVYEKFIGILDGTMEAKRFNYREALRLYKEKVRDSEKMRQIELEAEKRKLAEVKEKGTKSLFAHILDAISYGIGSYVDARIDAKTYAIQKQNEKIIEVLNEAKIGNWSNILQKQLTS